MAHDGHDGGSGPSMNRNVTPPMHGRLLQMPGLVEHHREAPEILLQTAY